MGIRENVTLAENLKIHLVVETVKMGIQCLRFSEEGDLMIMQDSGGESVKNFTTAGVYHMMDENMDVLTTFFCLVYIIN